MPDHENTRSIPTDLLLFTSRVQGTWLNSETVSRDGCSDTIYALHIRSVIYLVENLTKYLDYKFDKIRYISKNDRNMKILRYCIRPDIEFIA